MSQYTLTELRRELKSIGYKVKIKTYSEFKSGTIMDLNGEELSGYFSPEELNLHREKHCDAFAILDKYKGNTFDGMMRIVLS